MPNVDLESLELSAVAWAQLWQVTLTILVVAVVVRLACRRRPHLAYLLWMLVIVKALVPPVLTSPTGVFSWLLRVEAPVVAIAEPPSDITRGTVTLTYPGSHGSDGFLELNLPPDFDQPPSPEESAATITTPPALWLDRAMILRVLLMTWLAGALALAAYAVLKWRMCLALWRSEKVSVPPEFDRHVNELAERLRLSSRTRARLRVLASRAAGSPAVFGVWRPTLLLPAGLVAAPIGAANEVNRDAILAHELIHVRRGDPAAAILQLLAQTLWWFHPLVWYANREARRERERACDEEVVTGLGCPPADYARALLHVLERQTRPQPAFAVPGVGMLGITARRMEHLLRGAQHFHKRTPRTYYLAALIVLLLIAPGAGLRLAAAPADSEQKPLTFAGAQQSEDRPPAAKANGTVAQPAGSTAENAAGAKARARLLKLGADVNDYQNDAGKRELMISFQENWKGTIDDLKLVGDVAGLTSIYWDCQQANPEGLAALKPASRLEVLTLGNPTDEAASKVTSLPATRDLVLSQSYLSNAGMNHLVALSAGIEGLVLDGAEVAPGDAPLPKISDAGFTQIATLGGLKSLSVHNEAIADAGLAALAKVPRLESLTLMNCPGVTGAGFASLAGNKSLKQLTFEGRPILPEALRGIGQLRQLRSLTIELADIAPAEVAVLSQLTGLRHLSISHHQAQDENAPREPVRDSSLGDALLGAAGKLPELRSISLFGFATTDKGLAALENSTQLRTLALTNVDLADAGLTAVGGLTNLQYLDLTGKGSFTAEGMAKLAGLSSLVRLELPGETVTNDMLAPLTKLPRLEQLSISTSKITGRGLTELSKLKGLETLRLGNAPIDDEGIRALVDLPRLERLHLSGTKITDKALANVAMLANLRDLQIDATAVTDDGLAHLRGLKKLRSVSAVGSGVTEAGAKNLEASIPGLFVMIPRDGHGAVSGYSVTTTPSFIDDEGKPAGLEAPQDKPAPPQPKDGQGAAKPVQPTIVVTANVILWDNRIITWDQMVLRLRTMRADGPIHPQFKFTNGSYANGAEEKFHKRLWDIYKELFEPAGMSLGSIIPRAGTRLDRIQTEDDLRPDPALARQGRVLTPEGQPAVGAQVIVVPPKESLPVALSGKALRDVYDEQVVMSDDDGNYVVYPDANDYSLVILHESGCDVRPVPQRGKRITIELSSWAVLKFSSTGGEKEQSADVTIHPAGVADDELEFQGGAQVEREPLEVPVPAGRVLVSRTLKVDDSTSISMPFEQLKLAAGEAHEAALEPPTAADREKAGEFHRRLHQRAREVDEREAKPKDAAASDEEKQAKSLPGAGEGAGTSTQARAAEDQTAAEQPSAQATEGGGDAPSPQPSPEGRGSEPAKKEREYKATGRFIPADATPLTDPDPQDPIRFTRSVPMPVRRLRDLGAFVDEVSYDGDPPGVAWNVTIRQGWKGTDDDFKLINELPDVAFLFFDLAATSGAGIGGIKLAAPAEHLTISPVTDEVVAKITGLPAAKNVTLSGCSLSAAGCQRLATLLEGATHLTLQGVFDPANRQAPPTGIDDAGLKDLGQIKSLNYLELIHLGITDAGLAGLSGLKELKDFRIIMCPGVRGSGYASLAPLDKLQDFSAYMMPLSGDAIAGLSKLAHLQHITFQLDKDSIVGLKPEDFAPLAKLAQLRSINIFDPQNPWAAIDGTPAFQPDQLHAALGDALLHAVGRLPEMRDLSANGFGASAAGVQSLANAPELRSLSLNPMILDDAGLTALGRLTGLKRYLSISGPGKSLPAGLAGLAPLSKLESLSIRQGGIADDALNALAPLIDLESLDLPDSKIRGPGLAGLAACKKLKSLSLVRAPITDDGCQSLVGLATLQDLNLSETKITDRGLATLSRIANLRSLNLSGTAVTLEGLATLAAAKELKSLKVEGLKASQPELAGLRQKLPGVAVDVIGRGWVMMPAAADKKAGGAGQGAAPPAPNTFKAASAARTDDAQKKPAPSRPAAIGPINKADGIVIYSDDEPQDKGKEALKAAPDKDGKPAPQGANKKANPRDASFIYAVPAEVAEKSRETAGNHAITITGRAIDEDNKPVSGAAIHLVALGLRKPQEIAKVVTDTEGRYEIRDVELPLTWPDAPQGSYQVYGVAPGRGLAWQGARHFKPENRPAGDKETRLLYGNDKLIADLKFGQEATIRGRLVDDAGAPIKGAAVSVFQIRHLKRGKGPTAIEDAHLVTLTGNPIDAMTDADGRFTLPGLTKETSAALQVAHPDFGSRSYEVAATDKTTVDQTDENRLISGAPMIVGEANLILERARQFKLRLLYGNTSQPAASVLISAWRPGPGNAFAGGKTDEQGQLTLNLPAGKYELSMKPDRASAPSGYIETKLPLVVPEADQDQPTVVRLPAACTLEIDVVDADTGKPIPKVTIAQSLDADGDAWKHLRIIGQTDEAGKFTQIVPPGKRFYGPGPQRDLEPVNVQEKPIDLPGGETVKLQFKLRRQPVEEQKKPATSRVEAGSKADDIAILSAADDEPAKTGEESGTTPKNPSVGQPSAGGSTRGSVRLTFTPDSSNEATLNKTTTATQQPTAQPVLKPQTPLHARARFAFQIDSDIDDIMAAAVDREERFLAIGGNLQSAKPKAPDDVGHDHDDWENGTGRGAIDLWDLQTRKKLRRLSSDYGAMFGLAFSPDAKLLATAGRQFHTSLKGQVLLWDLETAAPVDAFKYVPSPVKEGIQMWQLAAAFSRDGSLLAAGGFDRSPVIWSLPGGKEIARLPRQPSFTDRLLFTPDGSRLIVPSRAGDVTIWETKTWKLVRELKVEQLFLLAAALSPDGKTLAVGGELSPNDRKADHPRDKGHITLWDVGSGEVQAEFELENLVSGLAFSLDGRLLAATGMLRDVNILDWAKKETYALIANPRASSGSRVEFLPRSGRLMLQPYGNSILFYDLK